MNDLERRMKEQYEGRTRYMLPRRTYTIIRVDGKSFHTALRHAVKPFDPKVTEAMDFVLRRLCEEFQGCSLGYTQSDEASILLTDFATPQTAAAFDGNLQKICSISAAIAAVEFSCRWDKVVFDSRVFTIPDPVEVENYFICRQKDCARNSISSLAQSLYSPKQLYGKTSDQMQEMTFQAGKNWNDCRPRDKNGGWCKKFSRPEYDPPRFEWRAEAAPTFTKERSRLEDLVPRQWAERAEV